MAPGTRHPATGLQPLPLRRSAAEKGACLEDFFTHSQNGPVTVITFTTESLMSGPDIERASAGIESIIDQGGPGFVLDCNKLKYLSSQAIGMLVSIRRKVTSKPGGKLVLRNVGPVLMELIKITKLHKIFTIE